MAALVKAGALPVDKYGYRIYGVMAHLSPENQAAVTGFHRSIGVLDFATRPHCSIHNFYELVDINLARHKLREAAAKVQSFSIEIDLTSLDWYGGGGGYSIRPHASLTHLHENVVGALDGLVKLIYSSDSPYTPHTTILTGDAQDVERGKAAVANLKLDPKFEVRSVELIGRVGQNRGGEYRVIASFPLGASQ